MAFQGGQFSREEIMLSILSRAYAQLVGIPIPTMSKPALLFFHGESWRPPEMEHSKTSIFSLLFT